MPSHLNTKEQRPFTRSVDHRDPIDESALPSLSPERVARDFLEEICQEWKSREPHPGERWSISGE